MRARYARYEAPGWGVGELWTASDGVLLAHEIAFDAGAGDARAAPVAAPLEGGASPPSGTLTRISSRVGNGFPANESQSPAARSRTDERVAEAAAARVAELAQAFLAGEDVSFDEVEIDLASATPFQHAVAATIRAIPRGEVVAYGEVAALAGFPGAGRAVGTFCAHNRFMLVLPCHRVVGASGLGGYGSAGLGVKRRLLALEGLRL